MNLREFAEVTLIARRSARRSGGTFVINTDRAAALGVTPKQVSIIKETVEEIEQFTERRLAALEQNEALK